MQFYNVDLFLIMIKEEKGNDQTIYINNWSIINWKEVAKVVFSTKKKIWSASVKGIKKATGNSCRICLIF